MKTAKLFDAVNAASDRNSVWFDLGNERGYAVGVQFSGTDVAGTLSLEACIGDEDPNVAASPVFAPIQDSNQSVTNSDDVLYAVNDAEYRWVRVVWDYTSGTGNMTSIIQVKQPQRA